MLFNDIHMNNVTTLGCIDPFPWHCFFTMYLLRETDEKLYKMFILFVLMFFLVGFDVKRAYIRYELTKCSQDSG